MERLFIYFKDDVIKARLAMPHEPFQKGHKWNDIEFQISSSSLLMITWPILLPELEPESARSLLELIAARYPISPRYQELLSLVPELAFKGNDDEWVFFGGSFNPWHKGHQACLDLLPPDKTCFILPDRNPQKDVQVLEPVYTVISLISRIKFGKNHFMTPTFLLDQEKNPTVNWFEKLRKEYPAKKLSLLMGFDAFKNLDTWVRFNDLLPLVNNIYVASRLEKDSDQKLARERILAISPNTNIVFLGHHAFEYLSSTELRK